MELKVECQKGNPELNREHCAVLGSSCEFVRSWGTESIALTLNAKTAETLLKQASINNTLIQLNISELRWRGKPCAKFKPILKGSLYHLSFSLWQGKTASMLRLPSSLWEMLLCQARRWVLDPVLTHLQVRCAPDNIPEVIEVDKCRLRILCMSINLFCQRVSQT